MSGRIGCCCPTDLHSADAPKLAKRWEIVQPRTQSQRAPTGQGHTMKSVSSMAVRCLMRRRDEGEPLPDKTDQEIASAINRALFQQKSPAHIRIMNAKRIPKGANKSITYQKTTAAITLAYHKVIINAARMVKMGVIDVEENESWEKLKVHAVPLVRYMGKGTEGLRTVGDEIHAQNKGVVIRGQLRRLANPDSIREMRQRKEMTVLSVVFAVNGDKLAWRLVKEGIKAERVWYRVKRCTNVCLGSTRGHCSGLVHIESKCSGKPTCGCCSGPHCTSSY